MNSDFVSSLVSLEILYVIILQVPEKQVNFGDASYTDESLYTLEVTWYLRGSVWDCITPPIFTVVDPIATDAHA